MGTPQRNILTNNVTDLVLHISPCIYLLSDNNNELTITNKLTYFTLDFTLDFMKIIFTN
jgi:hypothetical protein